MSINYERIIDSDVGDSYFQCGGMDYGHFSGVAVCDGASSPGLAVAVLGNVAVARECNVCMYMAFL